jgi:hypothetical protein
MRLAPDAMGSYINGTWTQLNPMSTPRLYFASEVLPNGKVWVLGGEYSGPGLVANISGTAEIYDPVSNTWSPAASYPSNPSCGVSTQFGGYITSGSAVVTGILSTAGWQLGWQVNASSTFIPTGTTIASIDSGSQIHLSSNAATTAAAVFTLTTTLTGNVVAGSNIIAGLPSTTGLQAGFSISGAGIPFAATVSSVDSATQIHISQNATATTTSTALTFTVRLQRATCFGDDPSILLPNGGILAGSISSSATYIYDVAKDTWSFAANKTYSDSSDEESWARLDDGTILTYDIFKSNSAGAGYAERYNPVTNTWSSVSPAAGTAAGTLPILSASSVGSELGGLLRLQDGRIFVIGANGHTALYTPSTNSWAAGPDLMSTLGGAPFLFAADDAPAAILPNGHVLTAADAGVGLMSTGTTATGSNIITAIPATASLQTGWTVSGTGIPLGSTIKSVDSPSQVTISQNATATNVGIAIKFGGTFSPPTQILDFDPVAGTISPVSPALPDSILNLMPSFRTRMLVLPTGQLLFADLSTQLWIYTPAGAVNPALQPTIDLIAWNGASLFTLSGTQLTGQSAGAVYGDDVETDEDYPIVRLVGSTGNVYYARTTNWNPIGVGVTGPQTVNFTLPATIPPGTYSLFVSAAGISSAPATISVAPDLTLEETQTGKFAQGKNGATYTISVSNLGNAATTGAITVTNAVPAGLTAVSIAGSGWACTQPTGPCTRSDTVSANAQYPAITVTVNVKADAPATVTSTAAVSGGGETNTANNTATDVINIPSSCNLISPLRSNHPLTGAPGALSCDIQPDRYPRR